MTNVAAPSYKTFGDTTLAVYEAEFARKESPMLPGAKATYNEARPHSALFLAQAFFENQYETTGHIIKPAHHNPVSLRPWPDDPRGMPPGATGTVTAPDGGKFLKFETDADCVREWKRRLFDDPTYKNGVYLPATTLEEMLNIYAPAGDVHPITGLDNANIGYAKAVRTMLARFARDEGGVEPMAPEDDLPIIEPDAGPPASAHRFAIGMGHRNENRGGASSEIDWTPGAARALRDAIVERGGEAWLIQENDGDDDPNFSVGKKRQEAARSGLETIIGQHGTLDAVIYMHYNGGGAAGAHFIHTDGWESPERKQDNATDVRLARAMKKHVAKTNTVGFLSWPGWKDEPGVMSERETGAVENKKPNRLGEMVAAQRWQATTARIVAEAGSIDIARERSFINDPHWVRHVYAEALVDALEDVYGSFGAERDAGGRSGPRRERGLSPRLKSSSESQPAVAPTNSIPRLDQFNGRPEAAIPVATEEDGRWWFWIGREVRAIEPTGRNQQATEDSEQTGPELEIGEAVFATWGSIAANGRPFAYTNWGDIVWLEDTDMGITT